MVMRSSEEYKMTSMSPDTNWREAEERETHPEEEERWVPPTPPRARVPPAAREVPRALLTRRLAPEKSAVVVEERETLSPAPVRVHQAVPAAGLVGKEMSDTT